LTFMFRSTCFGRPHALHQELTTALTAFGFTLERSKVKPEAVNAVVSP
jgi:hypothetical protein